MFYLILACPLLSLWNWILSPEKLLTPRSSARLSRSCHLCSQLADERLQLSTNHIIPLRPGLNTMLGTGGSIVWLVHLPPRENYRAVIPPSVKSAFPENIRESDPDSTSEWQGGDRGGDEAGESVLLLLVVHGGQGASLLHAVGQCIQPVKGGGGQLPALAVGDLGVAAGTSSDNRGQSCGGRGGGDGWCHRGGGCGGRCSRSEASGGGGSSAGDWSTSASKGSTLDRALG